MTRRTEYEDALLEYADGLGRALVHVRSEIRSLLDEIDALRARVDQTEGLTTAYLSEGRPDEDDYEAGR